MITPKKIKKTNKTLAKIIFPKWITREIGKAIVLKETNALDFSPAHLTQDNKIKLRFNEMIENNKVESFIII